ncbi:prephenate dehydratase [Mytilinidion resinicola]|uniref:prephenate dehydratase n=1 Tax=Mytilinidion resinicola TaxID=574789 RepID=A0A6A6YQL5_9PEZI|nr:prephenate dehydratase [Mytilinidion resinicola]KAF2811192.1 prephenate dehydratase [Mytilinidion resinicola]
MADKIETVAFLGPKASYTHQATLTSFPALPPSHLHPQTTIADVFTAVQSRTATHGVVPFENSTNGSVVFTLDLFADLQHQHPDILVCGEVYVPVRHCLVGHIPTPPRTASTSTSTSTSTASQGDDSGAQTPTRSAPNPLKPRATPLADLSRVQKLYSHPQAWGQCNAFLSTYLKGVERLDVSSTSRAAELVAADASGASAAVSSEIAAQIHGLDYLARGIQDAEDNETRFFILRRAAERDGADGAQGGDGGGDEETEKWKTLIAFTVDHEDPGALAKALEVFKTYGLNLTSINARPSGIVAWNYVFFVEIKGRRLEGGEGVVNRALRDLGRAARGWRWLGSWESKLER